MPQTTSPQAGLRLALTVGMALVLAACGSPATSRPLVVGDAGSVGALARRAAPPRAGITGDVRDLGSFPSHFVKNPRGVWIYLPPGYTDAANASRRYPVLYMHDGNNLFDAATAFGGHEWGADETAQSLITSGQIPPMIIVGVGNTADRIGEYTWLPGTINGQSEGGEGALYARFLVEELKPAIDTGFRTKPGPDDTAVLGSSLGGLISFYLGVKDNAVFHKIGMMSPSIWWDNRALLAEVPTMPTNLKIWLDIGGQEGDTPQEELQNARDLESSLVQRGYALDRSLGYFEDAAGGHNEQAWAYRLPMAFKFLFGGTSQRAGSGPKRARRTG